MNRRERSHVHARLHPVCARLLPITLLALACFLPAQAAMADTITYANARFGVAISFPAHLFEYRDDLPANGDGVRFHSADGGSLAVWGSHNALNATPASILAEARAIEDPQRAITWSRTGDNWVVMTGYEIGNVFYERIEVGADGVLRGFRLAYPQNTREKHDPHIKFMGDSLTAFR